MSQDGIKKNSNQKRRALSRRFHDLSMVSKVSWQFEC